MFVSNAANFYTEIQNATHPAYQPNVDDTHADASVANRDPFKFSHGLSGVDQPANFFFVHILIVTALIPVLLILGYRLLTVIRNDRRIDSLAVPHEGQDHRQRKRRPRWRWLKRHFVYAPVLVKRDAGGSRITSTSLRRPQATIIMIYCFSNIAYCLAIPNQLLAQGLAEFRGRCGTLAVFNLIFTVLFALRNNPLVWMLHISHDTFNVLHRWLARLVVLETIAHVLAFVFNAYSVTYEDQHGWRSVAWVLQHSLSYRFGAVAFIAFLLLVLHSISPLRHAFYETFLNIHRIGVLVAISGVYFHLAKHALPQLPWILLVMAFLILEHLIRVLRMLYCNFSWRRRTWTQVTLEALPGDATRVTFSLPRSWNANPGAHSYIYIPRLALWSSHPFSVAWTETNAHLPSSTPTSPATHLITEKSPSTISQAVVPATPTTTLSCIVRARTGLTRTLHTTALTHPRTFSAAIEGPYGAHSTSLDSYATVVLFAAGVGITHQLPFVRHLLAGHSTGASLTRRIVLVWCVTHSNALEWVRDWLEDLADMPGFSEVVRIRLFVSKMSAEEVVELAWPPYVKVRARRCDVQGVVDGEVLGREAGWCVVSTCGPARFNAEVREAVRRRIGMCGVDVDFVEEGGGY